SQLLLLSVPRLGTPGRLALAGGIHSIADRSPPASTDPARRLRDRVSGSLHRNYRSTLRTDLPAVVHGLYHARRFHVGTGAVLLPSGVLLSAPETRGAGVCPRADSLCRHRTLLASTPGLRPAPDDRAGPDSLPQAAANTTTESDSACTADGRGPVTYDGRELLHAGRSSLLGQWIRVSIGAAGG